MRIMGGLSLALTAMLAGCAVPGAHEGSGGSSESDGSAEVLTVDNNADLAALLKGPAKGRTVEAFSEKHRAETIEFEGFVTDVYINPREHNGESTIEVMAGDADDASHAGPVFQLGWFGHDSPLEKFREGDNVRVTALVGAVYDFAPHHFYLVVVDDAAAEALEKR